MGIADYINKISDLAREVEVSDPIDWGTLPVSEEEIYNLVSNSVVEELNVQIINENVYFGADRDVMVASIVNLVVENFVLNLKLTQKEENGNKAFCL